MRLNCSAGKIGLCPTSEAPWVLLCVLWKLPRWERQSCQEPDLFQRLLWHRRWPPERCAPILPLATANYLSPLRSTWLWRRIGACCAKCHGGSGRAPVRLQFLKSLPATWCACGQWRLAAADGSHPTPFAATLPADRL